MSPKRVFYFPDTVRAKRRRQKRVNFFVSLAYKYMVVGSTIAWLLVSNIITVYSITGKNPFDFSPGHRDYILFITVSTALTGIFPASYIAYLYYKNNKSQTSNIRNDLKLLGLVTEEEYDEFDKMYETFYTPMQFGVFIFLLSIISNLILAFFYFTRLQNNNPFWHLSAELLFYAFLGSYLFGVRLIIRRYNTFDLQPQVYASIILRIIISGTIAVGVSALFLSNNFASFSGIPLQPPSNSNLQAPVNEANSSNSQERKIPAQTGADAAKDTQKNEILPWQIFAFLIGVFPEQGLRWLSIIARRAFRDSTINQFNERPLRKIVGINEWHEARLEELGIDDAQGLATANISKLLLTTQFDTMQIVNWVDQAILHMKAGTRIEQFLAFQITTYSDLYYLLKKIYLKKLVPHIENDSNMLSENNSEHSEVERVYEKVDEILTEIRGTKKSSFPSEDDEYDRLLISLGFSYSDLERLCDYSNYPNFISIQEYYRNRDGITRQQSRQGTEEIIKSIDIGGEVLDVDETLKPESLTEQQLQEIELNIQELRFQLFSCRSPRHGIDIGLNLGKLLYLIGRLNEASKMFDSCLEVALENNINSEIRSRIYAGRGLVNIALGIKFRNVYFQNSDTNNNVRNYEGSLKEDYKSFFEAAASDNIFATNLSPSNVDAFNNCALAYIEQENFDLAMQYLEKALQLNQRNGVAYYNRGVVRNTIGKTEREFMEADLDFERAYLLGYQPSALWGTWGLTLVNIGRYQEAVKHLSRAISLNPKNHSFVSRRGFAYLQLSCEAKQSQDLTAFSSYATLAGKDFETAIYLIKSNSNRRSLQTPKMGDDGPENLQQCPNNALLAKVYINYGSLKILEKEYQEAISIYKKFFQEERSNEEEFNLEFNLEFNEVATVYYNFANAHFRLGEQKSLKEEGKANFEEAAKLYQKAIDMDGDLIEAYYQIAIVYSRLNQAEEAKKQCNMGLRKLNEVLKKHMPSENSSWDVGNHIGVMTNRLRDLEGRLKAFKEKLDNSMQKSNN